ncbi:uncharacterized protein AMSG_09041 [Thecamonas trahens ATCC 50062]|uniref:Uncharacterized protein n=1 Tax=Thecamonas trahens ATCC 50062 TaxID=461836 RepID=A0A0L0DKF2_THETB|nr:hypothetical protein AMSG_09041 [Thecamonas trahens ATCC 50062]KNC52884.1 hypothetical protein AMSG_09041 [Thecamonas trahens ATCC 50062]|eukprot:XP_013754983.1 hypothetical protein AMSG_09041 [Thecamonas trahens ATCC 50062]
MGDSVVTATALSTVAVLFIIAALCVALRLKIAVDNEKAGKTPADQHVAAQPVLLEDASHLPFAQDSEGQNDAPHGQSFESQPNDAQAEPTIGPKLHPTSLSPAAAPAPAPAPATPSPSAHVAAASVQSSLSPARTVASPSSTPPRGPRPRPRPRPSLTTQVYTPGRNGGVETSMTPSREVAATTVPLDTFAQHQSRI